MLDLEFKMAEKEHHAEDRKYDIVDVSDGDAALQFISNGNAVLMTTQEEKRLVKKIDRTVVPLMC